jgi:hypothetical protein
VTKAGELILSSLLGCEEDGIFCGRENDSSVVKQAAVALIIFCILSFRARARIAVEISSFISRGGQNEW